MVEVTSVIKGRAIVYRVMIVDDMDIVRMEIKRLKLWGDKSGFIISEEARNGQEALSKIEKNPVDLVITDIKMPKIDGIELLRNIVEKNLCSCVVLLSDFSEFSYARQGIILGAFDYMAKPINEDELNSLLERASKFLENTRKEADRVKKLEETNDEKIQEFLHTTDILKLIELILCRDIKALDTAARIIDRIGANLNYDTMKLETVLKNGISEVVNGLLDNNPWLYKFIDKRELTNIDFLQCNEFDYIKTEMINLIQKILTILNKFQFSNQDRGIVKQVCDYVLENIDSELTLKIISDNLYMNRTYISETFKQKTEMAFIEYLTLVKMERAKMLIRSDNLRAYEIAEKLGFKDIEYFSKLFKKYTGMTPTEFRQTGNKTL